MKQASFENCHWLLLLVALLSLPLYDRGICIYRQFLKWLPEFPLMLLPANTFTCFPLSKSLLWKQVISSSLINKQNYYFKLVHVCLSIRYITWKYLFLRESMPGSTRLRSWFSHHLKNTWQLLWNLLMWRKVSMIWTHF